MGSESDCCEEGIMEADPSQQQCSFCSIYFRLIAVYKFSFLNPCRTSILQSVLSITTVLGSSCYSAYWSIVRIGEELGHILFALQFFSDVINGSSA